MKTLTFNPRLIMKKCECDNILICADYMPGGKYQRRVKGMSDVAWTMLEDWEYQCTNCGKWHKFDFNNPVIK